MVPGARYRREKERQRALVGLVGPLERGFDSERTPEVQASPPCSTAKRECFRCTHVMQLRRPASTAQSRATGGCAALGRRIDSYALRASIRQEKKAIQSWMKPHLSRVICARGPGGLELGPGHPFVVQIFSPPASIIHHQPRTVLLSAVHSRGRRVIRRLQSIGVSWVAMRLSSRPDPAPMVHATNTNNQPFHRPPLTVGQCAETLRPLS